MDIRYTNRELMQESISLFLVETLTLAVAAAAAHGDSGGDERVRATATATRGDYVFQDFYFV